MLRNLVTAFGTRMAPLFPRRPQYVAGLDPARGEFPFVWERTYASASPGALAQAIGGLLAAHGCRVDGSSASAMVGVCDLVQEARRRRIGKILLGTGVALAVVILLMMVSGVTDRALLEWVMTIDVLVGGFGLVQLRYPPRRVRRVVDVQLAPEAGGARVRVSEGVGMVEDDTLVGWLTGETAELREEAVSELAMSIAGQPGLDPSRHSRESGNPGSTEVQTERSRHSRESGNPGSTEVQTGRKGPLWAGEEVRE